MGEQCARPGMPEVAGAFGAQEINDPGRRRIILRRPGEQIVDGHEESLPDPRQDGRSPPKRASYVAAVDASGMANRSTDVHPHHFLANERGRARISA